MPDAFSLLGLEPTLTLSEEQLRAAFRDAGKSAHPDAGGTEKDFARLREAMETLASPSRRLRHWLDLRGIEAETRGTVDPALMDLFGTVSGVTQAAEALIRRRLATHSALALALLERETQSCIESVETTLQLVDSTLRSTCDPFPRIESGELQDAGEISRIARNLAFLERWRVSLRGILPRLV